MDCFAGFVCSRESEDFAVVRHSDAYTLLCEADWDLPGNIAASEEGGSGEEPKEGREEGAPPDAPGGALDVQFTDVAHQFKTLCFGYQLLQVSGLQLNVYNSFYYIPHEKGGKRWLLIMACFLIQVCHGPEETASPCAIQRGRETAI